MIGTVVDLIGLIKVRMGGDQSLERRGRTDIIVASLLVPSCFRVRWPRLRDDTVSYSCLIFVRGLFKVGFISFCGDKVLDTTTSFYITLQSRDKVLLPLHDSTISGTILSNLSLVLNPSLS